MSVPSFSPEVLEVLFNQNTGVQEFRIQKAEGRRQEREES
jgi:hypothetical protein